MLRDLAGLIVAASFAVAPAARAEIVIGALVPLSGTYAIFGNQIVAGATQAIADINKAGGVRGEKLALATVDDACDAKTAAAATSRLVAKQPAVVIGAVCYGTTKAAATILATDRIVQIVPATSAPVITDERAGPGLFRLAGRDDAETAKIGEYLANQYAGRRVAFLDDGTDDGKALADATRAAMNAAGLHETLTASFGAGAKDFGPLVAKLKAAGAEAVFVGGSAGDMGRLARALTDGGVTATLVSGGELLLEDFWRAAGDAGNGAIATFAPDPRLDPANAALNKTFRAAGVEPEGYVYSAYAAVQLWAAAAKAAGGGDFDKVVQALSTRTFPTVLGKVAFDPKGDAMLPGFILYQWRDGAYAPLAM